MNKIIIAIVAVFFSISFYSFMFSGAKDAAKNVKGSMSVTSVDKACKSNKDLCKEL